MKAQSPIIHRQVLRLGLVLIGIVFLLIVLRQFITSAFFQAGDRVHVLFYSSTPVYFSLETGGSLHYVTTFSADSRTDVPGGYDIYRIGAIQKLVSIEHNPDIFKRVFSRVTGSMLDYYFYPGTDEAYYGKAQRFTIPTFSQIFFSASNANFFDRLYLWFQFAGKRTTAFDEIVIPTIASHNEILLSDKTFGEVYIGYFYYKSLRQENETVQILYPSSYGAAQSVSRIVDGTGIRVVDLDTQEAGDVQYQKEKNCVVTDDATGSFSHSAEKISTFFGCHLVRGKGRLSDIVVYLNTAEKEWE